MLAVCASGWFRQADYCCSESAARQPRGCSPSVAVAGQSLYDCNLPFCLSPLLKVVFLVDSDR